MRMFRIPAYDTTAIGDGCIDVSVRDWQPGETIRTVLQRMHPRCLRLGLNETVADFTARLERAGQDTIDDIIDDFQAEIDNAKSFEDAANRILKRYQRQFKHRSKLAAILDNLRYVAASAGASNAKE